MNLSGRLAKLEAEYTPAGPPELEGLPFDFLDREAERWDSILDPVLETVDDAKAIKLVQAAAGVQFRTLQWLAEPGEIEDDRERRDHLCSVRRWFDHLRRWPKALATFLDRLPERMRVPVLRAGLTERERELLPGARPRYPDDMWLGEWLRCTCDLRHRVPPDIDREAFGQLVGLMLTRRHEVPTFLRYLASCRRTGLWVPRPDRQAQGKAIPGKVPGQGPPPHYVSSEFFPACPGCGAGKWGDYGTLFCHRAAEPECDWREWVEEELSP
jgi:hypothetical protein